MPRNAHPTPSLTQNDFLRSINVSFDADYPERVSHFWPTSKSIPVLRLLLTQVSGRSAIVTAPYGSGKSLVAAFALHIIENRSLARSSIHLATRRLQAVSPQLAAYIEKRAKKKKHGLVIALNGAQINLAQALCDSAAASFNRTVGKGKASAALKLASNADPVSTLQALVALAEKSDFDSVLIVWDEFGRHLEDLLSTGRAAELHQIQSIAEYCVRVKSIPVTFSLLTHRGVGQYSHSAPQAIRLEWVKVEGRFESIQYVDDSKEMYRLIAAAVSERRTQPPNISEGKWLEATLQELRRQSIFHDLPIDLARSLVFEAFPLHPVALYTLPRLAARIAQNERTMFNFLGECRFSRIVDLAAVYDYFSESMRCDTSAGGAHRQYLETETALRRATDPHESVALKSACLIGLGAAGERGQVTYALLSNAVSTPASYGNTSKVIDSLIAKKLLLHRRHTNDVSVWHGADVDLRGALEREKDRFRAGFNTLAFIKKELPPPAWRPVQFNDDFAMRRYFSGKYVSPSQFSAICDSITTGRLDGDYADGAILFVLAENLSDQKRVHERAAATDLGLGNLVAVPTRQFLFSEAALEVACLENMIRDTDLIAKDPLVEVELQSLLDDARTYLKRAIEQLIFPQTSGPIFWHQGRQLNLTSSAELRSALSMIALELYPLSPKINNELINRRHVSRPIVNARKKLEMALLERAGQEGLGIQGNFPDSSMFRSIFLNTSLYRQSPSGAWCFAEPSDLNDPGLSLVWGRLQDFFQSPSGDGGKSFKELFGYLQDPPIGLRTGVIPILLAAAFRAFPRSISVRRHGEYVPDILPSVVEDICKNPEDYALDVLQLSPQDEWTIDALEHAFLDASPSSTTQGDRVRRVFDCLVGWYENLPVIAKSSTDISQEASRFRSALASRSDPVHFLFKEVPEIFQGSSTTELKSRIVASRRQIEESLVRAQEEARSIVNRLLQVDGLHATSSLKSTCQRWITCIASAELTAGSSIAIAFVNRLRQKYDSDEIMLDSLSSHLAGVPISRWGPTTSVVFEQRLGEAIRAVEDEAVRLAASGRGTAIDVSNITRLLESRLVELTKALVKLGGDDRAVATLRRVTTSLVRNSRNDDDTGSGY